MKIVSNQLANIVVVSFMYYCFVVYDSTRLFKEACKKQRNCNCVSFGRKTKKEFDENLIRSLIEDNKTLWKQVKHLFSAKHLLGEIFQL